MFLPLWGLIRPFTGRRMEPAAMGALCRSAAGTGTAASKPFLPASPLDGLHGHLSSPASRLGIVFSAGCRWNQGVPAGADWTKPFRLMEQPNLLFAAAQRDASYSGRLLCRFLDRPLDEAVGNQEQRFYSGAALCRVCGAACSFHCVSHWGGPCGAVQSLKRKNAMNKTFLNILLPILLCWILCNWFVRPERYNREENRYLAATPSLTLSKLLDGSYGSRMGSLCRRPCCRPGRLDLFSQQRRGGVRKTGTQRSVYCGKRSDGTVGKTG